MHILPQVVGASPARLDGRDKVSGRATYAADLRLPGMAVAALLASPLPHARIVRLDARAAERLPGVCCVLTQDDLTRSDLEPYYGPALRDQPIVAIGKVRFAGEPVAAVAATDEATAEEALELIEVEYEELPAVLDPHQALATGAPRVHEALESTAVFADLKGIRPDPSRNICNRTELRQGEVAAAFARCARMFEDVYRCPPIQGLPLEPHCCLAQFTPSDSLTVWSTNQIPFFLRAELARMFHLPINQVRVVVPTLGGGFGSKAYVKAEPIAVALARKARVPVKLTLSSRQVFTNTHTRHGCEARVKLGVDGNGRMVAAELEAVWDTGAYADTGPRVSQKAAYTALGPYGFEHLRIISTSVFTNKVPAGAFRGYGVSQTAWALESHVDRVAHALGVDPLEFRLRNLVAAGSTFYNRADEVAASARACLLAAAEQLGWESGRELSGAAIVKGGPEASGPPFTMAAPTHSRWVHGRGLACALKATVTPTVSQARLHLHQDGTVTLQCGTVEMGQGSNTALAQIAAQALELPLERVRLAALDTEHTPYDQATGSSRSTYSMGGAITAAAEDLKQQARRIAAERFEVGMEDVAYAGGWLLVVGNPATRASLAEVANGYFGMQGGVLVGQGVLHTAATHREELARYPATSAFWTSAAAAVEVAVDRETGQVQVVRFALAADAGKAINPRACSGQLEGSAVQALGHALQEELVWDNGQPLNFSLLDYPVPLFDQLPEDLRAVVVEQPDPRGPFGAKGAGEVGITVAAPAIANAVHDALGVRVQRLPLSPERMWQEGKDKKAEGKRTD